MSPAQTHNAATSKQPVGVSHNTQSTKLSGYQQVTHSVPSHAQSNIQNSKLSSVAASPGQSSNGTFLHQPPTTTQNFNIQNQVTSYQQQHHTAQGSPKAHYQAQMKRQVKENNVPLQKKQNEAEEEKIMAPLQKTQPPARSLLSYENGNRASQIDRGSGVSASQKLSHISVPTSQGVGTAQQQPRHKPSASNVSGTGQPRVMENRQDDGEKILNKRHQMRMTSGDSKRTSAHNITKSMIEDGSEDFTNIEEHIQEEARVSCRNAVASSLNNVSNIIQQNLRNRRGTNQSNLTGPSNQVSKEETFETSSFFDEGVASNAAKMSHAQINSPHRCNQVEGYNIPTIFNTLMFGIDQSKVSSNVRESFSKVGTSAGGANRNTRPSSRQKNRESNGKRESNGNQRQYQQKLSNQFSKNHIQNQQQQVQIVQQQPNLAKNASKEKLSQLITKVDKSPILVFDNSKQQQNLHSQQNTQTTRPNTNVSRNQEKVVNKSSQNKNSSLRPQQSQSPQGRKSQLSIVAQQNLKIEQQIEPPESLCTEVLNRNQEDTDGPVNDEDFQNEEIIQKTVSQIEDFQTSELHRNHLIQTLQSLQYIKTLPPANKDDIKKRTVKLPNFRNNNIKKTIIFDLDETLVHCIDDIESNPCDQVINVTFPNGETVQAGINIRPYALECLRKANETYQVVVFTASHKAYADVVLDHLDPDRSLIQYRLYRDHCIRTEEGIYIKDLRIINNRNLKDLIIVDNAVYSFGYQLDNGIPIIPFYDDKNDEELMHLIFYINCLANCQDVREQNRKAFQLKDLQEIDIAEYLSSMMSQPGGASRQGDDDEDDQ